MSDEVDIGEPIQELCKRLGLDYANVARLDIWPTSVVAEVFKLRDGSKYIDEDGKAAIDSMSFTVST